ncbi:unnamed protein product [Allacma fusca]|uniref:Uncharacterized protein n=1 Tax=Allacma fusca TaxID=39272 RepID=A0A8J2JRH6_9HEXA|nr:unnamed protein product [Allacma fusca]
MMSTFSLVLLLLYGILQIIYLVLRNRVRKPVSMESAIVINDPVPVVKTMKSSRFYKIKASECGTLDELLSGEERQIRKKVVDLLEICRKGSTSPNSLQGSNQTRSSSGLLDPHFLTEVAKVCVDEFHNHTLRGLKIPLIIQDQDRIIVAYKKNSKL